MRYSNRLLRRRRNSKDKWEVVFTYTDPETEEKIPRYFTVEAPSEAAAKKKRDELRHNLENERIVSAGTYTVGDCLDKYIKRATSYLEASTVKAYEYDAGRIKKYPIAKMKLVELSIDDVSEWLDTMIEKGYESRTCQKSFGLMKAALKGAMADDLIIKNPCDFVRPPRKKKKKINFLQKNERRKMLELSRSSMDSRLGLGVEFALVTGMRRGELCALRWSDISNLKVVHVHSALGEMKGGYYVKGVKNGEDRYIHLIPETYQRLMDYKARRIAEAERLGVEFGDPYVLGTFGEDSRFYNPDTFGKDFSAFSKIHGFKCTLHDLRHTFATFLIAEGADIATVASYLGDSIEVTLKNYATSDPEAKLAAVSMIERGLGIKTN